MKIASFGFNTPNLGDDLQVLAASLFLPRIDTLVDRDWLNKVELSEPHLAVMNSWFQLRGKKPLLRRTRRALAPSSSIHPVFYGFCVGSDKMLRSDWPSYLKQHAPIGARDPESVAKLESLGISAYRTACTTAFMGRLLPPVAHKDRKGVVIVDIAPEVEEAVVPQELRERAVRISTFPSPTIIRDPIARMHRMAAICELLRRAELVISRRLHASLPSMGFGTPVVIVQEKNSNNIRRYSGYSELIPTIWTNDAAGSAKVDWDNVAPATLPDELVVRFDEHLERLEKLAGAGGGAPIEALATCSRFVLPNPGLGSRPGEIVIDTGVGRVTRAPTFWSDREIVLDMEDFASFGHFNFPVLGRAYGAEKWVEIGPVGSFRVASAPVPVPDMW